MPVSPVQSWMWRYSKKGAIHAFTPWFARTARSMASMHPSGRCCAENAKGWGCGSVADFVAGVCNRHGKGFIDFGGGTKDAGLRTCPGRCAGVVHE
ncbi:hypothetical protein GALMADRAFT_449473 [Galerina marginata CBS 339.88]|uniref:Uncharacterized protein n=1 Tax=Galerina marginata (strain CBS 339.88) TaxID=685588 RepID=A0A067T017_GALM3|nr:hypothetical protein GALMADRAFT_449473 [Galerina marginata CBS 339.88]